MSLKSIEERWKQSNLSVFAFALELFPEEISYLDKATGWLSLNDLNNFRHALIAYWFRRFYDNSNGGNFIGVFPFSKEVLNPLWQAAMGDLKLCRETFIANCWMLNAVTGADDDETGNRGWTSDIWWNIRRVISCDDPENRFDIAEYGEDLMPYMKHLLEYCTDPESSVGRDFRSFVEDYTTGTISAEQGWKSKLKESFDTRFTNGANLGFYLCWDGGPHADYIVGLDHFRGETKQLFFYDEQKNRIGDGRTVQPPFMSWTLPRNHQKIGVKYSGFKHSFNREDYDRVRIFFPASALELKHWWQFAGGMNPHIPYNRNVILIRGVTQDAEIQIPETEFFTEPFSLTLNGERVDCLKITFTSRPERDTECQVEDVFFTLSGARPVIEIISGKRDDITSSLQIPVCSGSIRLQGMHMPGNSESFQWQCSSSESVAINNEGELSGLPEDSVSIVSVSLRDGDNRIMGSLKLLHLPEKVELRESAISMEEKVEERKLQRQRFSFSNPDGKTFEFYRKDTSFFWWFEEGFSCRPQQIKESPKISPSDFERMSLCIPNDLLERDGGVSIQIGNTTKTFHREKCGPSSYASLKLNELLQDTCEVNDYIYGDEAGKINVLCDGNKLFQFDHKPLKPYLCRNTAGGWGVFLPESKHNLSYRVLLYSDAWDKICSGPLSLENGSHSGRETFVSLKDKLEEEEKNDPDGEWFLALSMNHLHAGESDNILLAMDFPSNCTQMICIRPENAVWNGNPAVKALLHTENIPESHPFRKSRLYKFATSPEPVPYEECHPFWLASAGFPERLGTTLHTLLLSGYNFLAEPGWFFHALQDMREKCPAAHGGQKLTKALRASIDKVLIDNQDKRDAAFKGKGLCSAIVAQEQIDQFVPLNPGAAGQHPSNQFRVVRELSRLNGSPVKNLGIHAHYTDGYHSYSRLVTGTKLEKKLVCLNLDSKVSLLMNRQQPDNWECNPGELIFQGFSLPDPAKFRKAEQGDVDLECSEEPLCSEEEQTQLDQLLDSLVLQSNLTKCAKDMVTALHRKESCDDVVISTVGLIICVHNTVCRNNSAPEHWPLKPDNANGKLLCNIVRRLFEDKWSDLNDNDLEGNGHRNWRTLMRSIVPMMGLLSYINRGGNC